LIAPCDSNKLLIGGIAGDNNDEQYFEYQGNGHQGNLLDVKDGKALMIDQQVRMIDIKKRILLWSQAVNQKNDSKVWGRIGDTHSIIASGQHVKLYDNHIGEILSSSPIEKDTYVTMHNKMLLYIGERSITGCGDSDSFENELIETIASDPKNYHAHISFAVLREAQGKNIEAFHHYLNGLLLGAPIKYCEYAALLLRPHLNLQLDSDLFETYLEELQQLEKLDPIYKQEALWWQARHSESTGAQIKAIEQYKAILNGPSLSIKLSNKMSADLHFMARSSIQRLNIDSQVIAQDPVPKKQVVKALQLLDSWHIDGGTTIQPLCTERKIIAYVNGFLRCIDARNGTELWKQKGDISLPMLGISPASGGKNKVNILMGMAAQFSGMKSNDAITQFNGESIHDWNGIVSAVGAAKAGSQFTVTVTRDGELIELTGELGSRPMQAVQHNKNTVLTQYVRIQQDQRNPGFYFPVTDTTNTPHVQLYDLQTGDLLWHHTLSRQSLSPLLSDHDLLIEASGVDLIARDIRDPQHPIRWSVKGGSHELDMCRIEKNVLIGIDRATMRANIRNHLTGASMVSIPMHPEYDFILRGDYFLATLPDGNLALWRLSTAELMWTAQEALLKPIAISKTNIYCRNARDEMYSINTANGLIHRRYPKWSQISHQAIGNETLYIIARSLKQKMICAAIHIPTGNITWEYPLSDQLQFLNSIQPTSNGAYFKFGQAGSERDGFLHISEDGEISSFTPSKAYDRHAVVGDQLVLQGFTGLRISLPQQSLAKEDIIFHKIPIPQQDFKAFSAEWIQSKEQSAWKKIDNAEYMFAHDKNSIVIACRFEKPSPDHKWHDVFIRFADGGPVIDHSSSLLHIQIGQSVIDKNTRWALSDMSEQQDDEGRVIKSFRLTIPPLRAPGIPLLMHIEQADSHNHGIWWLHKNWHQTQLEN
ncbi:MAG: PDZ domain-containing protein, partial [Planctomycetes bacterium]|nr:PDZ domain-containing protein [Planctomycetota bacterium]